MINQPDALTTTVQFGKDGIGSIGLTVRVGQFTANGKLTMQQLISELKIGDPFDPAKDITELPKVELLFTDPASVEAMINCLKKLKHNMEYPYPAYCYAC